MWTNDKLKSLEPFQCHHINSYAPKFIRKSFIDKGITDIDKMIIPIQMTALLGQCGTDKFIDCPNIPEHYDDQRYLDQMGQFYWFDFDIIDPENIISNLPLRMALNTGDADCNDGVFGAVWHRQTEELIANIKSTGDGESTIEVLNQLTNNYIETYRSDRFITVPIEQSVFFCTLYYAHNENIERLIGLSIILGYLHIHDGKKKQYDLSDEDFIQPMK